ncbi:MAG: protein kinase [Myxococcales bacterium]|nr:protein kinase [Myxococcales bacterium]
MLGKVVAGRYRLEARLGEGGMGIVYRARHVLIDRVVALKLIRPDLRGETHLRAWMLREARAANRVDHAHIIDIHDIGETEDGELYLVMEYLVGIALSAEVGKGAMGMTRAVDILEQMCAALARAHDLGVVHRDLKSDNILLTIKGGRKDFVKILDFGLAALARDPRLAPKGAIFGTPEYMSPEQARGEDAGPQSDLYALGVLYFEMLTGQLPFRSGDRDTLLEMQRTAPPPRPRQLKPEVTPAAEAICLRLLEKDVRKRYQDAHHLQEELKALQRSLPSQQWDVQSGDAQPAAPPPPPPAQGDGVLEWANRASLFARMVARVYPAGNAPQEILSALEQSWILAARASRLEGEVASQNRKIEALERRGRALRAEIGRKVEELAHEESRVLREASADHEEAGRVREQVAVAERAEQVARQQAEGAAQTAQARAFFERLGGAAATTELRRERLREIETRAGQRESAARDLRKQIEDLRGQLGRYAEALEEDLASGRERIAARAREGLAFEKAYGDVTTTLMGHLKGKAECRDLYQELIESQRQPAAPQTIRADVPNKG